MARVPYLKRADLDDEGREWWDRLERSRGSVPKPYELLMASPAQAAQIAEVGLGIRVESTLDEATREIIVLTVARDLASDFEYTFHEGVARKAGVRVEVIESIRNRKQRGMIPQESVFVDYARQVIGNRVNAPTFTAVEHLVGSRGAVEATVLAGFYAMMCLVGNALELELPDNMQSLLPPAN